MDTEFQLAGDEATPDRPSEPALELRLTSTELAHTPGIFAWTLAGYSAARQHGEHVGPFIAVLADGYDLGAVIAERALRGDIPHRIEGDAVVLRLGELDAITFEGRHCRIDRKADGELPF